MSYQAWSAKHIEDRIVEAAEILMLDERVGPSTGGGPILVVRDASESYGYDTHSYRRVPTPAEITRMVETWGFVNAHPVESERRLLYAWAWTKAKRGRFLSDFASREGIKSRTLRRAITAICQAIADRLNQNRVVRLDDAVDAVADEAPKTAPSSVSSPRHVPAATHLLLTPDARPVIFPADSPEMRALQRRLDKANKRRQRARKAVRA